MNNNKLNLLSKKRAQQLKLLVYNDKFQEKIKELRKKWTIPENGYKSVKGFTQKMSDIKRESQRYMEDRRCVLRDEIDETKEKHSGDKYKQRILIEAVQKKWNQTVPMNAFHRDIKAVQEKFDLPPSWKDAVKYYLMLGRVDFMPTTLGVTVQTHHADLNPPRELTIIIDKFTTLEDIKTMWPMVENFQDNLSPSDFEKQQPIPNLDLYIRAKQLKSEGKKYDKIAEILTEEFGLDVGYENVAKYIYQFNQISSRYYSIN